MRTRGERRSTWTGSSFRTPSGGPCFRHHLHIEVRLYCTFNFITNTHCFKLISGRNVKVAKYESVNEKCEPPTSIMGTDAIRRSQCSHDIVSTRCSSPKPPLTKFQFLHLQMARHSSVVLRNSERLVFTNGLRKLNADPSPLAINTEVVSAAF